MKYNIVLLIALGLLFNTSVFGQNNKVLPTTTFTPRQMQQMDLIQLEVIELTKMIMRESILLDSFNNAVLGLNDQLGEMGFQNFQLEIEAFVIESLDVDKFERILMPVKQNSSVMKISNDFQWITLDQKGWHNNTNTPVPTAKFRLKNWRGTITPGVSNYYY